MNRHFAGSDPLGLLFAVLCVALFAPVRSACAQAHYTGPKEVDTSTVVEGDTTDENLVSLVGRITSVHISNTRMTFFNIGRSWAFAAVVLPTDSISFPNPKQWEGKRVRVTGKVQRYEARAAVVLRQPWQLALASPGPNPK